MEFYTFWVKPYSDKLSSSEKIAGPMLADRAVEVSNIYNRHKDEFTESMACILKVRMGAINDSLRLCDWPNSCAFLKQGPD